MSLKITQYTTATIAHANDVILGVNVHDTTMAPSGSCYGYPLSVLLGSGFDNVFTAVQGSLLYRGVSAWQGLGPGNNGQVLTSGGSSANPSWTTVSGGTGGSGTVNSGSSGQVAYYAGAGTAVSGQSLSALIDTSIGNTQGGLLFRGASAWSYLAPGTTGYFLTTAGAGANPSWAPMTGGGGGTVTSVATGTGLSGGPITGTGTIAIAALGVGTAQLAANAVTYAKIQVEAASSLLGNPTSSPAAPVEITLGAGLSFSGTTLVATGGGGGSGTVNAGTAGQVAFYSTSAAAVSGESLSALLDTSIGNAQGDILYRGSAVWSVLTPGTAGMVLTTGGASANPSWQSPSSGIITEVSVTTTLNPAVVGTFYAVSGSSSFTATLPTAVGIAGQVIRFRCASGYSGLLTIATTSSQTIGPGAATSRILYAGEAALLQSDGSNWVRLNGVFIPCSSKMTLTPASTAIPRAAETLAALDAVMFDTTGRMANTGTNSITIFRTGFYRIVGASYWGISAGNAYNLYAIAYKNATTGLIYNQSAFAASGFTGTQALGFGGSYLLNAGDIIILKVFADLLPTAVSVPLLGGTTGPAVTFLEVQEGQTW